MIDFSELSTELFQVLRTYGRDIVLYDENGQRVFEPADARRFYVTTDNILVSINKAGDDSAIRVYLSDTIVLSSIQPFLDTLRNMATSSNLLFHVKKFSREIKPQDFATRASLEEDQEKENMNQNIMEGLYGTSRSSYLKLENARMIVRHNARINEQQIGSRGRYIQSIFIENAAGERVLFPTNILSGARAMTQHVNQGGSFTDAISQQIQRMASDFKNLAQVANFLNQTDAAYKTADGIPASHTIQASGIREHKDIQQTWSKTFKNQTAMEAWCQANNAIVTEQSHISGLDPITEGFAQDVMKTMHGLRRQFARIGDASTYVAEAEVLTNASALMEDQVADLTESIEQYKEFLNFGESLSHNFDESVFETIARLVEGNYFSASTDRAPTSVINTGGGSPLPAGTPQNKDKSQAPTAGNAQSPDQDDEDDEQEDDNTSQSSGNGYTNSASSNESQEFDGNPTIREFQEWLEGFEPDAFLNVQEGKSYKRNDDDDGDDDDDPDPTSRKKKEDKKKRDDRETKRQRTDEGLFDRPKKGTLAMNYSYGSEKFDAGRQVEVLGDDGEYYIVKRFPIMYPHDTMKMKRDMINLDSTLDETSVDKIGALGWYIIDSRGMANGPFPSEQRALDCRMNAKERVVHGRMDDMGKFIAQPVVEGKSFKRNGDDSDDVMAKRKEDKQKRDEKKNRPVNEDIYFDTDDQCIAFFDEFDNIRGDHVWGLAYDGSLHIEYLQEIFPSVDFSYVTGDYLDENDLDMGDIIERAIEQTGGLIDIIHDHEGPVYVFSSNGKFYAFFDHRAEGEFVEQLNVQSKEELVAAIAKADEAAEDAGDGSDYDEDEVDESSDANSSHIHNCAAILRAVGANYNNEKGQNLERLLGDFGINMDDINTASELASKLDASDAADIIQWCNDNGVNTMTESQLNEFGPSGKPMSELKAELADAKAKFAKMNAFDPAYGSTKNKIERLEKEVKASAAYGKDVEESLVEAENSAMTIQIKGDGAHIRHEYVVEFDGVNMEAYVLTPEGGRIKDNDLGELMRRSVHGGGRPGSNALYQAAVKAYNESSGNPDAVMDAMAKIMRIPRENFTLTGDVEEGIMDIFKKKTKGDGYEHLNDREWQEMYRKRSGHYSRDGRLDPKYRDEYKKNESMTDEVDEAIHVGSSTYNQAARIARSNITPDAEEKRAAKRLKQKADEAKIKAELKKKGIEEGFGDLMEFGPSTIEIKYELQAAKAKISKLSPFDPEYRTLKNKIEDLEVALKKNSAYGKGVEESVDTGFDSEQYWDQTSKQMGYTVESLQEGKIARGADGKVQGVWHTETGWMTVSPLVGEIVKEGLQLDEFQHNTKSIHELKSELLLLKSRFSKMTAFDPNYAQVKNEIIDLQNKIKAEATYGKSDDGMEESVKVQVSEAVAEDFSTMNEDGPAAVSSFETSVDIHRDGGVERSVEVKVSYYYQSQDDDSGMVSPNTFDGLAGIQIVSVTALDNGEDVWPILDPMEQERIKEFCLDDHEENEQTAAMEADCLNGEEKDTEIGTIIPRDMGKSLKKEVLAHPEDLKRQSAYESAADALRDRILQLSGIKK